jgi:putative PEP-CTERM system TPR-repeat lipoprotein
MKLLKLLVVVGLLNGIVACSESDTVDTHIAKSKTYLIANKTDESTIELKNAIKKSPKNSEARFLLGRLYLRQGVGLSAVKELEKAHEYQYASSKVIPLLARAYILVNADDDVIDLNEQAQQLPDDVKSQYLAYNILANIRLQNNTEAKKSEQLANKLAITTPYTYLASAYLLLSENKAEAAKIKVKLSLGLLPENPDAIMLLGQINTALGLFSSASQNYLKYAELQPKSNMVVLLLADSLLKEKNYTEAEKYADLILNKVPNQPIAHYVKSMVHFEAQNYEKASSHANKAESFGFNSPKLKLVAGASAYYLNNFEQSHHHLKAIVNHLPAEHAATKMFVISQLQLGLIDDITETLDGFNVTNTADVKFLSTLSMQLAEIGALDDAKKLAAKVTSKQADNAEDNVRTGILKLMLNDPSGMTDLQHAISLKPDMLSAELALVSAAVQVNDFDKALDISREWQQKYPKKPGAFNVLATVYLKQGKLELAKDALNKSLNLLPKNKFSLTHLINIAFKQKDIAEAARLSAMALEYFPNDEKLLKQYYAIYRGDEQKKVLASEKIKAIFEADNENLQLSLLYAEVLLDQGQYKQALTVLDSFDVSIHSPNRLWKLKVLALININEDRRLVDALESWIRTNPYAAEPTLLLADYYMRDKKVDFALKVIDKALKGAQSSNETLKVAKMQILLNRGKLQEAKYFYPDFSSQGMNDKIVQGIKGRIYLLEKNYLEATPLLKNFYADFPSSQNAILLAVAQKNVKADGEAIKTLEVYLDNNSPDNNQVRSLLANLYLAEQPEKSIPLYEKMLTDEPKNMTYLNNLAWLNLDSNNLELAMKYSSEAVKLAPTTPHGLDTRGLVLLKVGEEMVALKALESAYKFSKGHDTDITLNYVEVLIVNKKNKEALSILAQLDSDNLKQNERVKRLTILAN